MPLILTPTPISPAAASLEQIRRLALQGFSQRLATWQQVLTLVWKSADPQAVIDLMGADARNNFAASAAEGEALAALSALIYDAPTHAANLQRIGAISAAVPPFTVNADGTVTIDPPPTPAP